VAQREAQLVGGHLRERGLDALPHAGQSAVDDDGGVRFHAHDRVLEAARQVALGLHGHGGPDAGHLDVAGEPGAAPAPVLDVPGPHLVAQRPQDRGVVAGVVFLSHTGLDGKHVCVEHVAQSQLDRVHAEQAGGLVDEPFTRPGDLRLTETPVRPGRGGRRDHPAHARAHRVEPVRAG
jgi:hypothetical protein